MQISRDNLASYPEDEALVGVLYCNEELDPGISFAIHEKPNTDEDCPFTVRTLTRSDVAHMMHKEWVAFGIRYIESGGKVLGIGHYAEPESLYHNLELFSHLFPWLYPYSLGGFKNAYIKKHLDQITHVQANLKYCDHHFQMDHFYPFIVFSHEQMCASYTGGYLLTKHSKFLEVADKLLGFNLVVLDWLAACAKDGSYVTPEDNDKKCCFKLISIIDHVGGHVSGSNMQ